MATLNFNVGTTYNLDRHPTASLPGKAALAFLSSSALAIGTLPRHMAGTLTRLQRMRLRPGVGFGLVKAATFMAGAYVLVIFGLVFLLKNLSPSSRENTASKAFLDGEVAVMSAVTLYAISRAWRDSTFGRITNPINSQDDARPLARQVVWLRLVQTARTHDERVELVVKTPPALRNAVADILEAARTGDEARACQILGVSRADVVALGDKVLESWSIPKRPPLVAVFPMGFRKVRGVIAAAAKSRATVGLARKALMLLVLAASIMGASPQTMPVRSARSQLTMIRNIRAGRERNRTAPVPYPYLDKSAYKRSSRFLFELHHKKVKGTNLQPFIGARDEHTENVLRKGANGRLAQRTLSDIEDVVAEYSLIVPGFDFCRSTAIVVPGKDVAWKRSWFRLGEFAYLVDVAKAMNSGNVHHIANQNSFSPSSAPLEPRCGVRRKFNLKGTQAQQYAMALDKARHAVLTEINEELLVVDTELKVDITNDNLAGLLVKISRRRTAEEIRWVWEEAGGIVRAAGAIAAGEGVENKLRHVFAVDPATGDLVPLRSFKQFQRLHGSSRCAAGKKTRAIQ